jgi:hypothetical protein
VATFLDSDDKHCDYTEVVFMVLKAVEESIQTISGTIQFTLSSKKEPLMLFMLELRSVILQEKTSIKSASPKANTL